MKRAAALLSAALLIAGGAGVARELSSSSAGAASCSPIGYQNGVAAASSRMKKLDPGGFNASGTGAWDKFFRTSKKLVDDHDAACSGTPPPTTTAPPPTTTTAPPPVVAPLTFNAEGGSNARFCVAGLPRNSAGKLFDAYATYDDNGLQLGGRSENQVAGLRGSRSMDGLGPCDGYDGHPPWPAGSYER